MSTKSFSMLLGVILNFNLKASDRWKFTNCWWTKSRSSDGISTTADAMLIRESMQWINKGNNIKDMVKVEGPGGSHFGSHRERCHLWVPHFWITAGEECVSCTGHQASTSRVTHLWPMVTLGPQVVNEMVVDWMHNFTSQLMKSLLRYGKRVWRSFRVHSGLGSNISNKTISSLPVNLSSAVGKREKW